MSKSWVIQYGFCNKAKIKAQVLPTRLMPWYTGHDSLMPWGHITWIISIDTLRAYHMNHFNWCYHRNHFNSYLEGISHESFQLIPWGHITRIISIDTLRVYHMNHFNWCLEDISQESFQLMPWGHITLVGCLEGHYNALHIMNISGRRDGLTKNIWRRDGHWPFKRHWFGIEYSVDALRCW